MANKKIISVIVVLLVISSFASCAKNTTEPKDTRSGILQKIQESSCSTPREFANLIVEIRDEMGSLDELDDSFPCKGAQSDLAVELRKNESVLKYLEAPFTDDIPEILHLKGLSAKDIYNLYKSVLEGETNIDRYAVKGEYPLETYITTNELPTTNDIMEQMKKYGNLQNPESLQVHSVTYYLYGDVYKKVRKNISSAVCIGTILVDYSVQNGFGGYNRAFADFKISSSLSYSLDSIKLHDDSVKFAKTLTSVPRSWRPTW